MPKSNELSGFKDLGERWLRVQSFIGFSLSSKGSVERKQDIKIQMGEKKHPRGVWKVSTLYLQF